MNSLNNYNSIGKRLENLRTFHNLKQKDVAAALHITSQAYSHYEHDRRMPDLMTAARLAQFFNVPLEYFVDDKLVAKAGLARYLPKALSSLSPKALHELYEFYIYLRHKYGE